MCDEREKTKSRLGTTKVQLDAESANGADCAEREIFKFLRKREVPCTTAKNSVVLRVPPSAPSPLVSINLRNTDSASSAFLVSIDHYSRKPIHRCRGGTRTLTGLLPTN